LFVSRRETGISSTERGGGGTISDGDEVGESQQPSQIDWDWSGSSHQWKWL